MSRFNTIIIINILKLRLWLFTEASWSPSCMQMNAGKWTRQFSVCHWLVSFFFCHTMIFTMMLSLIINSTDSSMYMHLTHQLLTFWTWKKWQEQFGVVNCCVFIHYLNSSYSLDAALHSFILHSLPRFMGTYGVLLLILIHPW